MKKILTVLALMATSFALQAAPVTPGQALHAATRFWNTHCAGQAKPVEQLEAVRLDDFGHLYAFANGDEGFVVVSADDCVRPVLAYSFSEPFPTKGLHPALRYWLGGYEQQIAAAVAAGHRASAAVADEWDGLLADTPLAPLSIANVPALMTTRWDQGDPYNAYCPYDSINGGRTVVGCVATAMAQIMKYWNYPSFGQGTHSYIHQSWPPGNSLGTISADFGSYTYLWQFMPNSINESSFSYQRDAVAMLSFHCGVAVDMMYGISAFGGSAAYSFDVLGALVDYFKYDIDLRHIYRDYLPDSAWCDMLDDELAHGRPVYYSGSDTSGGHAFVLDGSDLEDRYHFNWGWSGYGDGFYTINNLAPGTSGQAGGNATYTFNMHQGVIVGIKPGAIETFDTVDYYDSICSETDFVQFRQYNLRVANMDTLLRHLDTIFRYHLKIIPVKYIVIEPNGGEGNWYSINYCPATGVVLPECTFRKTNCRFEGWCRLRSGEDTLYQPGQRVMLNSNRRFYAIWHDTTVVEDTVGIGSAEADALVLGPNPVHASLQVSLPSCQPATVQVFDALGRMQKQASLPDGNGKISLRGLPQGAYIVRVKTADQVYNRRIIKR